MMTDMIMEEEKAKDNSVKVSTTTNSLSGSSSPSSSSSSSSFSSSPLSLSPSSLPINGFSLVSPKSDSNLDSCSGSQLQIISDAQDLFALDNDRNSPGGCTN